MIRAENDITLVRVDDGADGKTYYTWIKYADSPTSGMSDNPSGKAYIGIAPNKTSATESTTYSDYNWSLIKGETGADGNGITTIKQYYARTTTFSKPSAESITSTTMPELDNTYRYLWMKEVIAFTKSENQTVITLIAARGDNGEMSPEQVAQLNKASQDASDAVSKVDNLEIGGRNLVTNSVNLSDFAIEPRSTHTTRTITDDYCIVNRLVNADASSSHYGIYKDIPVTAGEEYTVSCTVKEITGRMRLGLGYDASKWTGLGVWDLSVGRFTHTVTAPSSATFIRIYIAGNDGVNGGSVTVSNIKLEKGNKATDWTPAPEDVDAGIANVQTGVDSLNDSVFGVQTFEYILDGVTIPVHKREDGTYYYILNDEEVTVAEADLVHDADGDLVSYQEGGVYEDLEIITGDIEAIDKKVNGFDAREDAIYNAIQNNSLIARKNARVEENSIIITNDTTTEDIASLLNYLQLNADSIMIYGDGDSIVTIAKAEGNSGYMEMAGTSLFIAQESRLSTIRLRSADKIGSLAFVAGSDGHVSLREVLD